jgi:hypothetical protein
MAIDPGPKQSGYVVMYEDGDLLPGVMDNHKLLILSPLAQYLVVERLANHGHKTGGEIIDTAVWIGRFIQAHPVEEHVAWVYRKDVWLHSLAGKGKPRYETADANIRNILTQRYGGKDGAIGNKSAQGPLYDVKSHAWQALALGLYAIDKQIFPILKEWKVPK